MSPINPNKLYQNRRDGHFLGVCAGLADYFGVRASAVRVLTVIGLIFGFFPTAVAYFVLAFVLEDKPTDLYDDPETDDFWRTVRSRPDYSVVNLKERLGDIESRTRKMEAYMTSKQFRLHRELQRLEDEG